MPEVASEAGVSRATIYRYFASEEALLIEATLDRLVPDVDETLKAGGTDVGDRAARLTQSFYDHAADNETAFRAYLRAMLEPTGEGAAAPRITRGGRRTEAFEKVLVTADSSLDQATRERLVCALSALTGIEALIVMKDICGLDNARAREVLTWAARTLLEATLDGPGRGRLPSPSETSSSGES